MIAAHKLLGYNPECYDASLVLVLSNKQLSSQTHSQIPLPNIFPHKPGGVIDPGCWAFQKVMGSNPI